MKDNVWNRIPLQDYELHMKHETVGQLHLLNTLTKKYLEKVNPEIVMILGIAGGNGLEHINNCITKQVYGIDINQNYLNETRKRFQGQIPNLYLINLDISAGNNDIIAKANLIWAALIFEYVELESSFEFIDNNLEENGHLIVTIQENNGVSSVSQTGIETIKSTDKLFCNIAERELLSIADKFGFFRDDYEENILPNKKSLKTYSFVKRTMFRRIKKSFDQQGLMQTLNAQLIEVVKGQVKISCAYSQALTQQHGFFHAGVATSIADSACGYAALTMMPEGMEVLSIEFKINFLKPAKTSKLITVGKVLQSGKTLTVCDGYVYDETETKLIAKMTATMIAISK
jgi:uncharacterized protein (TIGR00369 family)